jgi:hypothetical protein
MFLTFDIAAAGPDHRSESCLFDQFNQFICIQNLELCRSEAAACLVCSEDNEHAARRALSDASWGIEYLTV